MYIITHHAFKRFMDHYCIAYGPQPPETNYKSKIIGLFLNSYPCRLQNFRYKRNKYDLVKNVKSIYRRCGNWLFTIVNNHGLYYITTVTFKYYPKPKIIKNEKISWDRVVFTEDKEYLYERLQQFTKHSK